MIQIIINCFVVFTCCYFWLSRMKYKYSIKFNWNTTFFNNIRYGFCITWWKKRDGFGWGKPIFKYNWADQNKIYDPTRPKEKRKWARWNENSKEERKKENIYLRS